MKKIHYNGEMVEVNDECWAYLHKDNADNKRALADIERFECSLNKWTDKPTKACNDQLSQFNDYWQDIILDWAEVSQTVAELWDLAKTKLYGREFVVLWEQYNKTQTLVDKWVRADERDQSYVNEYCDKIVKSIL